MVKIKNIILVFNYPFISIQLCLCLKLKIHIIHILQFAKNSIKETKEIGL